MTGPGNPRPTQPTGPPTKEDKHGGGDRDRAAAMAEDSQAAGMEAAGVNGAATRRPAVPEPPGSAHVPAASPAVAR